MGGAVATVLQMHGEQDAKIKSSINVLETVEGDMLVRCSDGLEKKEIIGTLILAAINMAGR
jgi:hypothetical protein